MLSTLHEIIYVRPYNYTHLHNAYSILPLVYNDGGAYYIHCIWDNVSNAVVQDLECSFVVVFKNRVFG